MQFIQRLYNFTVTIKNFIKEQRASQVPVALPTKIKMWLKGFFSEAYVIYNLKENDSSQYLSDYARYKTRFINSDYEVILRNKNVFRELVSSYLDVPKDYGYVRGGRIYSTQGAEMSWEEFMDVVEDSRLIIKPVTGGGGFGVVQLQRSEGKFFLNKRENRPEDVKNYFASLKNCIISEFAQQGGYADKIFPDTANTIRLLTILEPGSGRPFMPIAIHKFGTSRSFPSDNRHQGGISAKIDIETGVMGKATYMSPAEHRQVWITRHPETDEPIEGVKIPNWQSFKDKLLFTAGKFPFLKYIGWDVVATDTGVTVIEGNNFSGVKLLQIHQGLLTIPQLYDFYKYHKVI